MTIKVFQWASGTVGKHAAREILRRPELELVGLHALSSAKTGRDVGEILDTGTVGVKATDSIQAILGSDADVVLHMPLPSMVYGENTNQDLDDFCTLLAGGKSVITVVGYLYPKAHGPEVLRRLEDACRQGNSVFHSTGLNPGFIGDLLPLLLSGLSQSIDRVVIQEVSSFEAYPSPEIMFDMMGFGLPEDQFETRGARRRPWLDSLFGESITMVADGLGLALDKVETTMTTALAPADLETASGVVPKGTVAGQHWFWSGVANGQTRIVHETVWRMHGSVAPEWPQGANTVTLEGVPRITLGLEHTWLSDPLLATAMHVLNAIEAVHAAPPGIQTLLDLPMLRGKL